MTFDQYIQNPMGVKNAVISNREMYRTMYTEKLNKILVRESGKVVYYLYKSNKKYYAYLKIPSEVVPNFYYDVIIEFSEPKDGVKITDRTLRNYEARFYSNDPSFVFTFAHAFIKNGMFLDSFKDKMSKEAVKQNADEKNPTNQIGYVKSLYFAYLIMNQRGLFNKILYVERYVERNLKSMVMDASEKITRRQQEGENLRKKNKKDKNEINRRRSRENIKSDETPIAHRVSNIAHTRKVGTIKKTNTVGTVKKTRTSKRK